MKWNKISDAVVRRLPLYLRVLDEATKVSDSQMISSHELGRKTGVGSALVRKDLAWFGEFGKQGVGYEIDYLRTELRHILNLDKRHQVVLVGIGSLGSAIARYNIRRFEEDEDFSLQIVGLFDHDSQKIGQDYEGILVRPFSEIESFTKENNVKMAIITVPASAAQEVAVKLVNGGVKAILNFAPVTLELPQNIMIASADLTLELLRLAYYLDDE